MRCAGLLAIAFLGVSLSAGAQRGGGHAAAAGHGFAAGRGGFGAGAAAGFRGSVSRPGAVGFARGVPAGARYGMAGRYPVRGYRPAFRGYGAAPSAGRPAFYSRGRTAYTAAYPEHHGAGDRWRGDRGQRGDYGQFYSPYGYPGFVSYGLAYPFMDPFWEYPDDPLADTPDETGSNAAVAGDDGYGGYAPEWAYGGEPAPGAPPPVQGYGQAYAQPGGAAVVAPAPQPLEQEDAVTLVFKDGRPPEQIRNYALTRTAIVIAGRRVREIPLQEIDLPATEKVNREAGVDFQLPSGR